MTSGSIEFAAICWLCSLIFGLIALWAFKRKDPMHFWSGKAVKSDEIADIPSYNRANGLMWLVYTACMVVTGIFALFNAKIGAILLVILCLPGVVVLIIVYNRIYSKYKSTSVSDQSKHKTNDRRTKRPQMAIIAKISISVIIFIAIGVLFYYGEKDPQVSILDDSIQIKAMYGLNIDFSEITDISLIEKSIKEMGVGIRTNGYGGFGGSLKGHFKSDSLGKTLLFVQSQSSPTLKIERADEKDVYISFRNSESTEKLYHDMIANIKLK